MLTKRLAIYQLVLQLYQPASPYEISQTERTLQELQRANSGWLMADALLGSEDTSVRFFGALTFTVKINCDWCVRYCCFAAISRLIIQGSPCKKGKSNSCYTDSLLGSRSESSPMKDL